VASRPADTGTTPEPWVSSLLFHSDLQEKHIYKGAQASFFCEPALSRLDRALHLCGQAEKPLSGTTKTPIPCLDPLDVCKPHAFFWAKLGLSLHSVFVKFTKP